MVNIIGDGGFAQEVAAYLRRNGEEVQFWVETKYVNRHAADVNELKHAHQGAGYLVGVGDPALKQRLIDTYCNGLTPYQANFGQSFSPLADGVIICPGTVVTTGITLGRHVHLNLNVTVGHDAVIGAFSTVNPGVNISGNVTLGHACVVGTGAAIREKITICDKVVIGAGAVIVKNITEAGIYVGNPARKL